MSPYLGRVASFDTVLDSISIWLGSVSPSPYKVALHKSTTESRTVPKYPNSAQET